MIQLGLFSAGVRLAKWLPAPLLYAAARVVAALLARAPSPSRRRVERNLAHVLGLCPDSPMLQPYVRRVYQTQAANYVDLVRSAVSEPAATARQFDLYGPGWSPLQEAIERRRGAVLVAPHLGRIELLSHLLGNLGMTLTLAVERLQPPQLFELICRLRARPTFRLVPHDTALRPCLRALARGELAVFFADWDPTGHGVPVQFFGTTARLPAGPAFIALRARVPLFVGYWLPGDAPGRYRGVVEAPIEIAPTADLDADVVRIMQQVARLFERCIARHPGLWVMFHEIWPPEAVPGEGLGVTHTGQRGLLSPPSAAGSVGCRQTSGKRSARPEPVEGRPSTGSGRAEGLRNNCLHPAVW